jgi:tetratricopeptide (TPR) repeat protein
MARKKSSKITVSQDDNIQARGILEQYHDLAGNLRTSTNKEQTEAVLVNINSMQQGVQVALLKALAREYHPDAADLLLAINVLSPIKDVRKEARRALIQLEGARVYPQWRPPVPQPLAGQLPALSLEFWKGYVTDPLDAGEVQLLLCWKQGEDEIRILGFLLDFWLDGVKDFFTRVVSQRSADKLIEETPAQYGVSLKECSLAEGRRLLLDALAVNKQHGTTPHKDYRNNLSLVNRLILEVPGLEEEVAELDEAEDEEEAALDELNPMGVVTTFIESWTDGDYATAYALLASESPLREGLSRDEWIERREAWADAAKPEALKPGFVYEREPQKSGLWLPFGRGRSASSDHKQLDAGWSIEMHETPLSDTLSELPKATAIYAETQRHWFWAMFTLVQEEGAWRIQSILDEGTGVQSLSVGELEKRIRDIDKQLQDFTRKHNIADITKISEEEAAGYTGEIVWHVTRATAYADALIKKQPLDRDWYKEAIGRMFVLGQLERCLVYLEPLTRNFEEEHGLYLRILGTTQQRVSQKYLDEGDNERAERFRQLAEEALKESLAVEESFDAHISLAEILIGVDRFDEAEEHLLRAQTMASGPSEESHVEMHLGEVATGREHYEEALRHYQRVAELEPDLVDSWVDLAEVYEKLDNLEEAAANYRRAIELEPDNPDLYAALSGMYTEHGESEKAIEALEDGLSANPDSAILNITMAMLYLEMKDYRQAEIFLDRAERLEPDLPLMRMFRYTLNTLKNQSAPAIGKLSRPGKKRKRR